MARSPLRPHATTAAYGTLPSWKLIPYDCDCRGSNKTTRTRTSMSIKGKAYIMGAYEHPTRHAPDKSTAQLHAECARGVLEDAGLKKDDIDGYFCGSDAPGFGAMSM